jgi:hypothetical protein
MPAARSAGAAQCARTRTAPGMTAPSCAIRNRTPHSANRTVTTTADWIAPDFNVGGIEPDIRPAALNRAAQEGTDALIPLLRGAPPSRTASALRQQNRSSRERTTAFSPSSKAARRAIWSSVIAVVLRLRLFLTNQLYLDHRGGQFRARLFQTIGGRFGRLLSGHHHHHAGQRRSRGRPAPPPLSWRPWSRADTHCAGAVPPRSE